MGFVDSLMHTTVTSIRDILHEKDTDAAVLTQTYHSRFWHTKV